jgi:hypothetical protein
MNPITAYKYLLVFLTMILFFNGLSQQNEIQSYLLKRQQIGRSGMVAYTSWSSVNLAAGVTCWASFQNEGKYFGQMNVLWSLINLGIAIPGLIGSHKKIAENATLGRLIQQQYTSETTYLINGGLDFLYIGTGAFLRAIADNHPKSQYQLLGYGDAFLLNGAFLLFFDFIQYFRHRNQRVHAKNLFLDRLTISDNGIGVKYTFN